MSLKGVYESFDDTQFDYWRKPIMGIMNLFRPKWKNSKVKVRLKAVKNLTDQDLLFNIATNDEASNVRVAAIERIADQNSLAEIAKHVDWTLEYIKEHPGDYYQDFVRIGIENRKQRDHDMRMAAVKKISEQKLLDEIYRKIPYSDVQKVVVEKSTNQALLYHIAYNDDNDSSVRLAAVEKMTDQKYLTEIAKHNENPDLREIAARKVTDQALLAEIAIEDNSVDIRLDAINKITNQDLLFRIAKNAYKPKSYSWSPRGGEGPAVRKAAAKKITDKALRAEITKYLDLDS